MVIIIQNSDSFIRVFILIYVGNPLFVQQVSVEVLSQEPLNLVLSGNQPVKSIIEVVDVIFSIFECSAQLPF